MEPKTLTLLNGFTIQFPLTITPKFKSHYASKENGFTYHKPLPLILYPKFWDESQPETYYSNYFIQNPNTQKWYPYVSIYVQYETMGKTWENPFYVHIYGKQAKLFNSIELAQKYINDEFDHFIPNDFICQICKL